MPRPVLTPTNDLYLVRVGDDEYEFHTFDEALSALRFVSAVDPADTFPCGWLVEQYGHPGPCEDDEGYGCGGCEMAAEGPRVVECGAPAVGTDRGWTCLAGHAHVNVASRHAEGWDYFDDDEIDAMRTGHFLPSVGMVDMSGKPVL